MITIFKRELSAYFKSMLGFVFLAAFYCLSGAFLFIYLLNYQSMVSQPYSYSSLPSFSMVFQYLILPIVLFVPLLTMRLISEEKRQKTDQALLTAPIPLFSLVTGKFLAAFTIYVAGAAGTMVMAVVVSSFSSAFDWLSAIGNFVGLILFGAAVIAIGVFVSSLTESQVIAAVLTYAILIGCIVLDALAGMLSGWPATVLNSISMQNYYNQFTYGSFHLTGLLFFLSVVGVFLFLTTKVLEKRRWN